MQSKELIELGLIDELKDLLLKNPELSNKKIKWGQYKENETDPLHYVSDCVFNGLLTNGNEAEIASVLIANGAKINGSDGAETPLIGAASLSVESVASCLIKAGANISSTSVHGANALHWASYVGLPSIVKLLLNEGADIEQRCIAFQATPLFWAVQGFHKNHPINRSSIVEAAEILVHYGADIHAKNFKGVTVLEWAHESENEDLIQVIEGGTKQSVPVDQ
jgi:ankyrin repeat protein